jgi:hypothetical protein
MSIALNFPQSQPLKVVTAMFGLYALAAAHHTLGATADGFAHVQTRIPPIVLTDAKGSGVVDGSATSGVALAGGSSASYNLFPQQGIGTISGQSAVISFGDWAILGHESQADAFVRISDRFHIDGHIEDEVLGNLRVSWSGTLSPNDAFEQEHFARFGQPTVTARARLSLSTFFIRSNGSVSNIDTKVRNRVGGQVGPVNPCSPILCVVGEDALLETEQPFAVTDQVRDFGFVLVIGAVGTRGGGFNMAGSGGTDRELLSAAMSGLEKSFFDIAVELPEGLSFTAEGGHYMQLATIPDPGTVSEPATLPLFALCLGLVGLLRWRPGKWRSSGSNRIHQQGGICCRLGQRKTSLTPRFRSRPHAYLERAVEAR